MVEIETDGWAPLISQDNKFGVFPGQMNAGEDVNMGTMSFGNEANTQSLL